MATRIALLLLLTAGALAQDAAENGKKDQPVKDPFAASGRMREGTGERFVPRDMPTQLPELALKGYIEDAAGKTVALLEVGGKGAYLVRKGDTLSLPRQAGNLVMRVVELTNLELKMEIGELRRVVVIR